MVAGDTVYESGLAEDLREYLQFVEQSRNTPPKGCAVHAALKQASKGLRGTKLAFLKSGVGTMPERRGKMRAAKAHGTSSAASGQSQDEARRFLLFHRQR